MQYIELNPVRVGMVNHPSDYRWSSYKANALGAEIVILTPHKEYLSLGQQREIRLERYSQLLDSQIAIEELDRLKNHLHSGIPLGDVVIEKVSGCSVGARKARQAYSLTGLCHTKSVY